MRQMDPQERGGWRAQADCCAPDVKNHQPPEAVIKEVGTLPSATETPSEAPSEGAGSRCGSLSRGTVHRGRSALSSMSCWVSGGPPQLSHKVCSAPTHSRGEPEGGRACAEKQELRATHSFLFWQMVQHLGRPGAPLKPHDAASWRALPGMWHLSHTF